jgi:hypothetical protein
MFISLKIQMGKGIIVTSFVHSRGADFTLPLHHTDMR